MRINNPQNFEGQNLISKEKLGLAADATLAIERTVAQETEFSNQVIAGEFLPEITALEKNAAGKMETVSKVMGPKINFIGDCAVRQNADGSLTIRIGENLNSSNFMTSDGQTTGVNDVTVTQPANAKSGVLSNGTSVSAITSGSYALNTATAGALIHFDNNTSTSFEVVVNVDGTNKTFTFGPIDMTSGTTSETAGLKKTFVAADTTSVTLTVSKFGQETKSAEGATGYCGAISFSIPASEIAGGADKTIKLVSVTQKNGGEGTFTDSDLGNTTKYYYTDTTTKPGQPTSIAYTVALGNTETKSGITYAKSGSATVTVDGLSNMFTPVGVASNVALDANDWATDTSINSSNGTSATGSMTLVTCCVATPTVTATPKNINGNGTTKTSANDYGKGIIVYTGSYDASINEADGTKGRITSTGGKWDSASALSASDLQLYQGKIVYPSKDFSGYNGVNEDRNYSGGTGDKVYYVKLSFARSTQQPTLTIVGSGLTNANLKAVCVAPTLAVIDNRNALLMTSAGGICDNSDNKSATNRVLKLSFLGFGETIDTAGAYAKIVMSGTGAEISSISLT